MRPGKNSKARSSSAPSTPLGSPWLGLRPRSPLGGRGKLGTVEKTSEKVRL